MKMVTFIATGAFILFSAFIMKEQSLSLYQTKWSLKKIHTAAGAEEVNTTAFIRFDEEKKRAGGNGSCNTFGGSLIVLNDAISISHLFSTKMYCEGAQKTEDNFFRQLEKVNRFEIKGSVLLLYHPIPEKDIIMIVTKKNSSGPAVRRLIERLVRLGYLPAGTAGDVFTDLVQVAVKNFQSSHVGPNGLPLKIDGIVGPLTQFAISVALGEASEPPNMSLPTPDIAAIPPGASIAVWNALQMAKAEMAAGAGEQGGDDRGPFCRKYLAATGLDEGTDCCAAFVSWCSRRAIPARCPTSRLPAPEPRILVLGIV